MVEEMRGGGSAAVETAGLVRRFGDFTAVDGIDLRVGRGSFFGFLGPNGAGKSTTIKMLTGLLAPSTGRMHGLGREDIRARSRELLELMELDAEPRRLVVEFSHGMKKKLALACALIHRPEILFLDEPFEGVDAVASRTLKDLLSRLTSRGLTVFLTSHVLEIVERLCTDIAIISGGEESVALSLEDYFISVVGGTRDAGADALGWLG